MVITGKRIKAEDLINSWVQSNLSFAIYKLPDSDKFNIIFSENGFTEVEKIDFNLLPPGFALAPFNSNRQPLFIKADFHWELEIDKPIIEGLLPSFNQSYDFDTNFSLDNNNLIPVNKEGYYKELNKIIKRIRDGEARKVVLSRKKHLGKLKGENFFKGFQNLCSAYPEAMVSFLNIGHLNQIWYGATPELLVSYDENKIFKTISLAATQSALDKDGNDIQPIDALWTHKEIEEQAIVGRYIINCLKKIRVREFEERGPKTIKAGNLLHLRTNYYINNKEVEFPNLSSVMLELLHPTPAVCGMPKEEAQRIIAETENYDREFYTGFLGPINYNNESSLFVNLRTMKIENKEVYAFAGGGLMEDSNPEKEWEETEIKLKTIAKAFSNL